MSLLRISFLLSIGVMLLTLNSCASFGGGDAASDLQEALKGVPKSYVEGLKAAQKGKSKQAVSLFEQAIKEKPDFAPALTNLGLQQIRLKDRKAAQVSLKKSLALNSNNAVAYLHLGVIARLNGDFTTALSMYEKALTLKPDYAIAHLNLGILQDLYLYDLPPALAHYEKYQSMLEKKDATVAKWIIDIKRRIKRSQS